MSQDKWKVIRIIREYPSPVLYGIFRGAKVFGAMPVAVLESEAQAETMVQQHNQAIA